MSKLVFHFGCIFLYILHVVHIVDGIIVDVCGFFFDVETVMMLYILFLTLTNRVVVVVGE